MIAIFIVSHQWSMVYDILLCKRYNRKSVNYRIWILVIFQFEIYPGAKIEDNAVSKGNTIEDGDEKM